MNKVSLALCFDLVDALHGGDCLGPQLSVVFDGDVATFLKLKGGIHSQLFACQFSEGLGVLRLPWVLLLLEGTVTFRTTKFENFTVISDKCHTIARIAG